MMLQTLIDKFYRHPKATIKNVRRFGGFSEYGRMINAREQMKSASERLSPVPSDPLGGRIYFLTGKDYLYQTLFCIRSLFAHCGEVFQYVLVDDGSMDRLLKGRIARQLPGAEVVTAEEIDRHLEQRLPEKTYPHLREKRGVYPHIKKLTDIHTLPGDPWKLVLDSDMLFFENPEALTGWLKQPQLPLHLVDCGEAYGYSAALMEQLAKAPVRPLVNVGVIGLNSDKFDWPMIEFWARTLESREGKNYFLEQALSAMIIAGQQSEALDVHRYVVNPAKPTGAILHHYVDLSKKMYYLEQWQAFC